VTLFSININIKKENKEKNCWDRPVFLQIFIQNSSKSKPKTIQKQTVKLIFPWLTIFVMTFSCYHDTKQKIVTPSVSSSDEINQ
jgi:hypothetical protein